MPPKIGFISRSVELFVMKFGTHSLLLGIINSSNMSIVILIIKYWHKTLQHIKHIIWRIAGAVWEWREMTWQRKLLRAYVPRQQDRGSIMTDDNGIYHPIQLSAVIFMPCDHPHVLWSHKHRTVLREFKWVCLMNAWVWWIAVPSPSFVNPHTSFKER